MSDAGYGALCAAAEQSFCRLMLSHNVAPRRRVAAAWGMKRAATLLGCREPRVQFFRPDPSLLGVRGAAVPGDGLILVAGADVTLAQTAGLSAHETAHAAGDPDEDRARALQRQVAAEWRAHRLDQSDQIIHAAEEVWHRVMPIGLKQSEIIDRLKGWYGSLDIAIDEWRLEWDEITELEAAAAMRPHAAVELRAAPPAAPGWSFYRPFYARR